MFDEADLKNRTNQWTYHIQNFNKERIIKCYNISQSYIPKGEHYISCIPPTRFINGQYK